MNKISPGRVQQLRLRAQHLHRPANAPEPGAGELMAQVFALQAQDAVAGNRSLWVRSAGTLREADIIQALEGERSIVHTWCMRSTLHLLPAADLGWLLPLFGSRFIRQGRKRHAQLGLTEEHFRRANDLLPQLLNQEGPLTRPELADRLAQADIPTAGQATPHLLGRAALEGIICLGPGRDGVETYVSLDTWLEMGQPLAEKDALARLARRYLHAFGPATPADMASWSGLTKTQAQTGFNRIRDELLELAGEDGPLWLLVEDAYRLDEPAGATPTVHLLPAYDALLLSYETRDLTVPAPYAKEVHPGGGLIRATLLVNGRAAGTWKATRRPERLEVTISPFTELNADILTLLAAEVQDLGRFHNFVTFPIIAFTSFTGGSPHQAIN